MYIKLVVYTYVHMYLSKKMTTFYLLSKLFVGEGAEVRFTVQFGTFYIVFKQTADDILAYIRNNDFERK